MIFRDFIKHIEKKLESELPGKEAQIKMSPSDRGETKRTENDRKKSKESAVLVLLYPVNNIPFTVFIKKNKYKGVHSGQVGFPGGMRKKTDKNLIETALREASEEIGTNSQNIKIIGGLTKLYIPVSNITVFPFVGYVNYMPEFVSDDFEIDKIIPFEMTKLISKETVFLKTISVGKHKISVPYYNIDGYHVWGATAMIVSEFISLIE